MSDLRASDVYLTADGAVGLTGVSVKRLHKWVRLNLLHGIPVQRPGAPGELMWLYCLSDIRSLMRREAEEALARRRRWAR